MARWSFKPGTGWILSDAPTLFPAGRYAQALAGARASACSPTPRRRRTRSVRAGACTRPMPLHLVTGPANSGKAGRVLAEHRARLADGAILVVPTAGDVSARSTS